MSAKVAADKAFPGQHDGEVVRLVFHQHPLVMRKQLIIGLMAILLGVLPLDFPQVYASSALSSLCLKVALITPLIVFAFWFHRWVGWYYTVYIVTDTRIIEIHQQGFFKRDVAEWQLDNITNVNYRIGGFQAVLFGYGDLTAKTYVGDLEIPTVHKPTEIHEQLVRLVRAAGGGSTPMAN